LLNATVNDIGTNLDDTESARSPGQTPVPVTMTAMQCS